MTMATGNGKSSPFSPDGKSGAVGNSGAAQPERLERAQRMGSGRNPASVPAGGPVLKLDPPSDRQGIIGAGTPTLARRPFAIARSFGAAPPAGEDEADD